MDGTVLVAKRLGNLNKTGVYLTALFIVSRFVMT